MTSNYDKKTIEELKIESLPRNLADIKRIISRDRQVAIDMINNMLHFYKQKGFSDDI